MIDYKALTKDELIELLEVMRRNCISFEEEKERAVAIYKKCGYDFLPYMEMKKEI